MLDITRSAFIKGGIYEYEFYNSGNNVSLTGTFLDFNGVEYIASNQSLSTNMFSHYFTDIVDYRENQINTITN